MSEEDAKPFTWSHFKWFVGFSTSILSFLLPGLFILYSLSLKAHADKDVHSGGLRKDQYEIDQQYLKRDLEHLNKSLVLLHAQMDQLAAAQMDTLEELLENFSEINKKLQ